MDKRCIVPILIVLTLIVLPVMANDVDAASGNVNGVQYSYFDDEHNLSINDTCSVSLGLSNTKAQEMVVTIAQTGDSTVELVSGASQYTIEASGNIVVALEFKPDISAHQATYESKIELKVFDPSTGITEKGYATFKFNITSIYSNEQYYNKILGIFDNPLPAPFNTVETTVAISLCLWAAIAFIVMIVVERILKWVLKGTEEKNIKIDSNAKIPVFVCVFAYGLLNCLRIYGFNPNAVSTIQFWMDVVYVPLIAFIAWKVYKAIVYRILNNLEVRTGNQYIYESMSPLLNSIGKIAIVVIATAGLLSELGLNLAVIITGAGIAGLAISLGTKSAFNEFFSGLTVLVTRPFKVGDVIRLNNNGEDMTVSKVGLLNTELKNKYNVESYNLPNSLIASSKIVNLTRATKKHRIYVYVTVDLHDDLELAKKLIRESGYEDPGVITDGSFSKPHVMLKDISNGIATFRLATYLNDVNDKEEAYGRLREAILRKFRENGVEIPFQKVTITIKDDRKGVTN